MSDEEKLLFAAELKKNTSLKKEYECQKQIINAVQKVAMRDFLAKHAQERQQERSNVDLGELFTRISHRIRVYCSSSKRVVWAVASAAAIIIVVVGGINYTSTRSTMRNVGFLAYTDLAAPIARDGNKVDALITQAYKQIGNNEWAAARSSIDAIRGKINESLSTNATTEEEKYEQQILKMKLYDLDWYEVIIFMKQGKIIKAKRALESIASSDSPYAETARNKLENIF